MVLSERNVVQPDILFIKTENLSVIKDKNIAGAPDLIIEILSPSSAYHDLLDKKEIYAQFGVQEYWIVDPKKQRSKSICKWEVNMNWISGWIK